MKDKDRRQSVLDSLADDLGLIPVPSPRSPYPSSASHWIIFFMPGLWQSTKTIEIRSQSNARYFSAQGSMSRIRCQKCAPILLIRWENPAQSRDEDPVANSGQRERLRV